MKAKAILALIALLASAMANASLFCENATVLFLSNGTPYNAPYYVGDKFEMAVDRTAFFSIQSPSGTSSLGTFNAHNIVGVTLTQNGPHVLRANRLGSDCILDEFVVNAPSLGTISVSGTLWTFNDLTFSVTSSGGASPNTYDWDFNDGNTANNGGTSVVHQYEAAGTYVVSVDLTDSGGRTDIATKTITVVDNPNVPGPPGPIYEDHLGCGGASAQHKISWSAPASGATASTYWLTITGGGSSSSYWNSTTSKTRWLTPDSVYSVDVRGCTSQSLSTCGPTRTGSFTSNACAGGVD